ncbi:MAG: HAD family phosphatase [Bacteroidales bacterium]|nr:HAD family phosphatase [Bacteroidales bacterium]
MIKNIVFDFGGVLVDWNPHYLFDKYFNDIEEANYFVENVCNSEWNAEMDGGKTFEQAVKERTAMFPKYAEALKLYQTNWMDTMGDEIPGMYDLIKSLKDNGFPIIYGLTNWSAETFPTVQKKYRIFSLIDKIIVSGEVKQLKPNPEIFHTLLNTFNLKAEESLFIDDNIKNVEGAKAVGINALRFENANKLKEDLQTLNVISSETK